tara:strand:- start:31 stop:528 length:498 start_codon:yes stop_codon:yes gene_type:complete
MDIDFNRIREMSDRPEPLIIEKIALEDGAWLNVQSGPFLPLKIERDPQNSDIMTLWYTRTQDPLPEIAHLDVQIRLFLDYSVVRADVHSYVGSFLRDGLMWHAFLDRTQAYATQRKESTLVIKEALSELSSLVDELTADGVDGLDKDEFIRRLLDSSEETGEENA